MRLDLKVLHHTEGPAELLTMKGTLIALLKSSQLKKKKVHEMASLPSHCLDFTHVLYRPLVVTLNCLLPKFLFQLHLS